MTPRSETEQLYARYIKSLSPNDRLLLLALIAHDLAVESTGNEPRERSILELKGLGAEIWEGVDAQRYVDELRDEWERDH